jgi:hypothetical protein
MSLPVPVSPVISTGESVWAMDGVMENILRTCGLRPTSSPRPATPLPISSRMCVDAGMIVSITPRITPLSPTSGAMFRWMLTFSRSRSTMFASTVLGRLSVQPVSTGQLRMQ